MNSQQRKAIRHITVKNNLEGVIEAIRGVKTKIAEMKASPEDLDYQIFRHEAYLKSSLKKTFRKLWFERKLNKWTN